MVTVWDFLIDALMPVGVVLLGAWVAGRYVVDQMRQTAAHRTEDRYAEAIVHLTQLMLDDADLVIRGVDSAVEANAAGGIPNFTVTALDRFRNNAHYVRGQALLNGGDTTAIANWTLKQSGILFDEALAARRAHGLPEDGTTGPVRTAAMNRATKTIAALFAWQNGQLATSWFVGELTDEEKQGKIGNSSVPRPIGY